MHILAKHIIPFTGIFFLYSCSVVEKSSKHGFNSNYYNLKSGDKKTDKVYVDVSGDNVTVYKPAENFLDNKVLATISLAVSDSLCHFPMKFIKKSLDIDITSNLMKFRPGIYGLPAQLTVDFNAALYAGWRHDTYYINSKMNPLGKCQYEVINRGYDFGFFLGPGTATVSPFSTRNAVSNEYNGMIIQYGLAGFIETDVASFGISTGFDYLLSSDRKVWIYNNKPWIGFIVGIALN
ncbi:hypothetical protein [Flavihumibacter profundi]|uniref:hypothetical protein n=1 Tax=Flavihumibacter profundi TaxID=2716883 RepID=UPI001CC6188F|nr:hypothetical protein [Flavihumibacter profundi]MBZ5856608.1 hypothetical protein [Flavihumibacter profundi]